MSARFGLRWRTREVHAQTHRGVYALTIIIDGGEYDSQAFASFHGHDGTYEGDVYAPTIGPVVDVEAACAEHAARQPSYPPLLGWPAEASHV